MAGHFQHEVKVEASARDKEIMRRSSEWSLCAITFREDERAFLPGQIEAECIKSALNSEST